MKNNPKAASAEYKKKTPATQKSRESQIINMALKGDGGEIDITEQRLILKRMYLRFYSVQKALW